MDLTRLFVDTIKKFHYDVVTTNYFDTVTIKTPLSSKLRENALKWGINLRYNKDESVSVSFDEAKTFDDVIALLNLFAEVSGFQGEMVIDEEMEF